MKVRNYNQRDLKLHYEKKGDHFIGEEEEEEIDNNMVEYDNDDNSFTNFTDN